MTGRVDVMLDTATSGFPRIRSGQFRALAVTSPERYPLLPEAPTVAETLPGVQYMSWLGLAAAPRTPRPIVDRLNAEVRRALELPEVQQKLKEGGNIATPTTPEAMRQQIDRRDRQLEASDQGQQHQGGLTAAKAAPTPPRATDCGLVRRPKGRVPFRSNLE